jgi:hypothetical protein
VASGLSPRRSRRKACSSPPKSHELDAGVDGYMDVVETVFTSWQDISPSENLKKRLHHRLLQYFPTGPRSRARLPFGFLQARVRES